MIPQGNYHTQEAALCFHSKASAICFVTSLHSGFHFPCRVVFLTFHWLEQELGVLLGSTPDTVASGRKYSIAALSFRCSTSCSHISNARTISRLCKAPSFALSARLMKVLTSSSVISWPSPIMSLISSRNSARTSCPSPSAACAWISKEIHRTSCERNEANTRTLKSTRTIMPRERFSHKLLFPLSFLGLRLLPLHFDVVGTAFRHL